MFWVLASAALAAAPPAAAAPAAESSDGRIIYPPEFFAAVRATTALEMVNRVPGFVLDEGGSARGFGGLAGNVLIDGKRPSTKSEGLSNILLRIPASSVLRLELIRGASGGFDLAGQSVVVNVVRRTDKPYELTIAQETRFFGDAVRPSARINGSYKIGPSKFDGEVFLFSEKQNFNATERHFSPPGTLDTIDIEPSTEPFLLGELKAGFERNLDNGGSIKGRFSGQAFRFQELSPQRILDANLNVLTEQNSDFTQNTRQAEISVDLDQPLGPKTRLKLVALQSLQTERGLSAFEEALNTPAQSLSEFASDSLQGESVLRATFSLKPAKKLTIETGAEGAYNFLESDVALFITDAGGRQPIPLPSSDVRVAEGRGEIFSTATYAQSPKLTLEAAMRVELSTIRQSGDTQLTRFFLFPKPRVLASYSPIKGRQFRFSVERTVGQLNFFDFVTSTNLIDDLTDAGNPDLEPDRAWEYRAALEQRWGAKGSATLTFGYDDLQAVADVVPVFTSSGVFDAPGNLGAGRRYLLRLESNIPLDIFGLKGAVLDSDVTWQSTEVTDPTTGFDRRISFQRPVQAEIEFRWDLEKLRSTATLFTFFGGDRQSFRVVETQVRDSSPFVEASWEYKGIKNTSIRFAVNNLANEANRRTRFVFDGPRGTGELVRIDQRTARRGPFGLIRIRRVF